MNINNENYKSILTESIEKFRKDLNSPEAYKNFSDVIRFCSKNCKWIYTVVSNDDKGSRIIPQEVDGEGLFVKVFSEEKKVLTYGNSVMVTSINKIISTILYNPQLKGIVFNPGINNLCIKTGDLLKMAFGEHAEFNEEKTKNTLDTKNITNKDIMTKEMLTDFGLQVFLERSEKYNCKIMFYTNNIEAKPSIIAQHKNEIIFIYVKSIINESDKYLDEIEKEILIKRSEDFDIKCYYTFVTFKSEDETRAQNGIVLKNDRFIVNTDELYLIKPMVN